MSIERPPKEKPSFGVIVGRFQVHELHEGHMELFRVVRGLHNRVVVFLGVGRTGPTKHNPLDYEVRKRMIQVKFPDITVLPIPDKRSDIVWSKELDLRIEDVVNFGSVTLYGSRNSFRESYSGKHTVKELELAVPKSMSGTDVRLKLTNTVMESPDFRAGIVYAMGQMYPRCVTTVDIAVLHYPGIAAEYNADCPVSVIKKTITNPLVLFGKKPGADSLWRFLGGYAEPSELTYEQDARKEVMEEANLDLTSLKYIGSTIIQDWRWNTGSDKIKTMLFVGESMTQGGKAGDDIAQLEWKWLNDIQKEFIEPEHRVLLDMLTEYLKGERQ